ncbi:MAG: LOG family protein, partial [Candidatus Omnitrophota bacterium]
MKNKIITNKILRYIKKTLAAFVAGVFLFNDVAYAADFRNLAPQTGVTLQQFRDRYLSGYILLSHKAINSYIEKFLSTDNNDLVRLIQSDIRWDKTIIRDHGKKKTLDIRIVPVKGLLKNTGQLGHIGLGNAKNIGSPTIYVDYDYRYDEDLLANEKEKIVKWEERRRELGKTYGQMRQWIQSNSAEARDLASKFHRSSRSVRHIYDEIKRKYQIALSEENLEECQKLLDFDQMHEYYEQFGLDENSKDANLAASPAPNEKAQEKQSSHENNIKSEPVRFPVWVNDSTGETQVGEKSPGAGWTSYTNLPQVTHPSANKLPGTFNRRYLLGAITSAITFMKAAGAMGQMGLKPDVNKKLDESDGRWPEEDIRAMVVNVVQTLERRHDPRHEQIIKIHREKDKKTGSVRFWVQWDSGSILSCPTFKETIFTKEDFAVNTSSKAAKMELLASGILGYEYGDLERNWASYLYWLSWSLFGAILAVTGAAIYKFWADSHAATINSKYSQQNLHAAHTKELKDARGKSGRTVKSDEQKDTRSGEKLSDRLQYELEQAYERNKQKEDGGKPSSGGDDGIYLSSGGLGKLVELTKDLIPRVKAWLAVLRSRIAKGDDTIKTLHDVVLPKDKPVVAVFDIHGTLLTPDWKKVYIETYKELLGRGPPANWMHAYVLNRSEKNIIETLCKQSKKDKPEVISTLNRIRYRIWKDQIPPPLPDVLELMKALRARGVPIALSSSSRLEIIMPQLKAAGILDIVPKECVIERNTSDRKSFDRVKIIDAIKAHYPGYTMAYFDDAPDTINRINDFVVCFGIVQGDDAQERAQNEAKFVRAGAHYMVYGNYGNKDKNGKRDWEAIDELLTVSRDIQEEDRKIPISNELAKEIAAVIPAARGNHIDLLIDVSDDFQFITYYIDGKKIVTIPSSNLITPQKYIEQNLPQEIRDPLLAALKTGRRYTRYRGITTSWDSSVDKDVWTTNIDTVFIHKVMDEAGVLKDPSIKKVVEVGVGGGHISAALSANLPNLEELTVTDISMHALRTAKRCIGEYLKKGIRLIFYLGKGVRNVEDKADLIVVNPPYIPMLASMAKRHGDAYRGTGLIREILEIGVEKLNPDNPNAQILMNISSLARKDLERYKKEFGDKFDIEKVGDNLKVPLKISAITDEWKQYLVNEGLLEFRKDAKPDEERYWHTIQMYSIKSKKIVTENMKLKKLVATGRASAASEDSKAASENTLFSMMPEALIGALKKERTMIGQAHTSFKPTITVFGSARIPPEHPMYQIGKKFGESVFDCGFLIRTGGGPSMMEAPLAGYIEARQKAGVERRSDSETQAISIKVPHEDKPNPYVEKNYLCEYFPMRKVGLYEDSVATVVFPGGLGTEDELFEVMSRGQPVVLISKAYWEPVIKAYFKEGACPFVADSPEEAMNYIKRHTRGGRKINEDSIKKANVEIEKRLTRLSKLAPSIALFGEVGEHSDELAFARAILDKSAQANVPVRVGSRGVLFDDMLEYSKEQGMPKMLQATLFVPESSPLNKNEAGFGQAVIANDISNYQLLLSENSRAFIFMSGGTQTMNAFFSIITQIQTKKASRRPIILVGRDFWEPKIKAIVDAANSYDRPLIGKKDTELFEIVDTVDECSYLLKGILEPQTRAAESLFADMVSAEQVPPQASSTMTLPVAHMTYLPNIPLISEYGFFADASRSTFTSLARYELNPDPEIFGKQSVVLVFDIPRNNLDGTDPVLFKKDLIHTHMPKAARKKFEKYVRDVRFRSGSFAGGIGTFITEKEWEKLDKVAQKLEDLLKRDDEGGLIRLDRSLINIPATLAANKNRLDYHAYKRLEDELSPGVESPVARDPYTGFPLKLLERLKAVRGTTEKLRQDGIELDKKYGFASQGQPREPTLQSKNSIRKDTIRKGQSRRGILSLFSADDRKKHNTSPAEPYSIAQRLELIKAAKTYENFSPGTDEVKGSYPFAGYMIRGASYAWDIIGGNSVNVIGPAALNKKDIMGTDDLRNCQGVIVGGFNPDSAPMVSLYHQDIEMDEDATEMAAYARSKSKAIEDVLLKMPRTESQILTLFYRDDTRRTVTRISDNLVRFIRKHSLPVQILMIERDEMKSHLGATVVATSEGLGISYTAVFEDGEDQVLGLTWDEMRSLLGKELVVRKRLNDLIKVAARKKPFPDNRVGSLRVGVAHIFISLAAGLAGYFVSESVAASLIICGVSFAASMGLAALINNYLPLRYFSPEYRKAVREQVDILRKIKLRWGKAFERSKKEERVMKGVAGLQDALTDLAHQLRDDNLSLFPTVELFDRAVDSAVVKFSNGVKSVGKARINLCKKNGRQVIEKRLAGGQKTPKPISEERSRKDARELVLKEGAGAITKMEELLAAAEYVEDCDELLGDLEDIKVVVKSKKALSGFRDRVNALIDRAIKKRAELTAAGKHSASENLPPPPGSLYGVFQHLWATNSVSAKFLSELTEGEESLEEILKPTKERIAEDLGLSPRTIERDLWGLRQLHLIVKVGDGRRGEKPYYTVRKSIIRKGRKILNVLRDYSEKNLKPNKRQLAALYRNKIRPILDGTKKELHFKEGMTIPGTSFVLGAFNDEKAIKSLRKWPEYRKHVYQMRPGRLSDAGFIGRREDLIELLLRDRRTLIKLGTTPQELAGWLERLFRNGKIRVNGQTVVVSYCHDAGGHQNAPLPGVKSSSDVYILKNLTTDFELSGAATA